MDTNITQYPLQDSKIPVNNSSIVSNNISKNSSNSNINDKMGKDFEAMMLSSMLQDMFKGVKSDGLFGGGHAEEIWRSFMIDEYANLMAENGSIGISEHINSLLHKYKANSSSTQ